MYSRLNGGSCRIKFYDSLQLGNFFGDILGLITALGLAVGAVTIRSAKKKNLVPAAVVGKLFVAPILN